MRKLKREKTDDGLIQWLKFAFELNAATYRISLSASRCSITFKLNGKNAFFKSVKIYITHGPIF